MKTSKRKFLRYAIGAPVAAAVLARIGVARRDEDFGHPMIDAELSSVSSQQTGTHTLPPLGYSFDALEPHINAETMQIHHNAHHATYVRRLNEALANYPRLQRLSPEELIGSLASVPLTIRTAVRNNGGGHVNHSMFWRIMSPQGGGAPTGGIAREINRSFGSFDRFKEEFNRAGESRFGSGWVWLVRSRGRGARLRITTTANQDNPLMTGEYPVMGNDVWEHAYYLTYRNRRAEYLRAWWNVVNWDAVAKNFGS